MGTAPAIAPAGLPVREYLLVALTSAAVTFLLTGLIRLLAIRFGVVSYPRQRDVHLRPMPYGGGVAMYAGILGGMLLAHQLPVLSSAFAYSGAVTAVLLAAGLIVLVGFLDDRFELDSLTKLAGQVTSAGILVLFGLQWFVFYVPWGGELNGVGSVLVLDSNQGSLLTVFLVVTMINAMNFVDGLDGLAAGLGLIASAATCMFALAQLAERGGDVQAYPPALLAGTMAGACLGFLPYNFQPAKLFMGDAGSMLIGLMLAASSTASAGQYTNINLRDSIGLLSPLLVVAAVLFVPLLDLVLAVIRRTKNGQHWSAPDKMHLHHRLLDIGHSQRRAVLLIYLWAGVLAFGAVALTMFDVMFVAWGVGMGLLLAMIVSAIPRLRTR